MLFQTKAWDELLFTCCWIRRFIEPDFFYNDPVEWKYLQCYRCRKVINGVVNSQPEIIFDFYNDILQLFTVNIPHVSELTTLRNEQIWKARKERYILYKWEYCPLRTTHNEF